MSDSERESLEVPTSIEQLQGLQSAAERLRERSESEAHELVSEVAREMNELDPAPPRRPFDAKTIVRAWEEQGRLCPLCGNPMEDLTDIEIDHKVPYTYGGGHEAANIQVTHKFCNRRKGSTVEPATLLEYQEGRYRNLPKRS